MTNASLDWRNHVTYETTKSRDILWFSDLVMLDVSEPSLQEIYYLQKIDE